jgi:hypothetical protein
MKMDKNNHDLLNEEIARQLEDLSQFETGSAAKSTAIADLAVLYKLRIEENKVEWDANDKDGRRQIDEESRKREDEIKHQQLEQDYEIKLKQLEEQVAQRGSNENSNEEERELKKRQINNDFIIKERQLQEQIEHRTMEEFAIRSDGDYKHQQIAEQKTDRYVKIGIAAAELILPIAAYGTWFLIGLCHERNNSFSLTMVKELLKEMRPTKK